MKPSPPSSEAVAQGLNLCRKRLLVTGLVQGVGFRPYIYRLAGEQHLGGWVKNTSRGVVVEVEGLEAQVAEFLRRLSREAPPLARVEGITVEDSPPHGERSFVILASEHLPGTEAVIPPDVGLCAACAREIRDPRDRRFGYPFTNCTDCGPRFTLIRQVPYDRRETTLAVFAMCPACREEYENPGDRRFHAEPVACPECGPEAWLEMGGERLPGDPLVRAGELLRQGKILAVKGLGGFHLACDARNDAAVRTLRDRKGRRDKPFAVMVRDLAEAARLCRLGETERRLLLSPERPIVLCPTRPDCGISPLTAPGNRYLGLLLPYTPLHLLLLDYAPPALVMTSGNLSEEPLVFTNEEARAKLAGLADALVMHNRDIQVPCDDSVVRPLEDGSVMPVRRARGWVPRPVALPFAVPEILGVGAEQKNTFCLAWGETALLSQHLGDLETVETYDFFQLAIRHFEALTRKHPTVVAHDLHPQYLSTRYARVRRGARLVGVQHHHAHVASCLAEHGRTGPCIGVALDGTGFGPDGTVWGGEVLVADLLDFTRRGHLKPVRLPGGEAAVRHPGRMAAAFLFAAYGEDSRKIAGDLGLNFSPLEWQVLRRQVASGWQAPLTTSAGRLFDAVAAATGICRRRSYEGQPALELEMAAHPSETGIYPFTIAETNNTLVLDTVSLLRAVVDECLKGVPPSRLAMRFHLSLAAGLGELCRRLRELTGLNLVVLSGGVFQNARLTLALKKLLEDSGFEVLTHRLVPPNDGGISLGQVAVAGARLREETGK